MIAPKTKIAALCAFLGACAAPLAAPTVDPGSTHRADFAAASAARFSVDSVKACEITPGGSVRCLDLDGKGKTITPGEYVDLSVRESTTCALSVEGRIDCIGGPSPFGDLANVEAFDLGVNHSAAIVDGEILNYGSDFFGQHLAPAGDWVDVAAGYGWTCALDVGGRLECWGITDGEGVPYRQHRAADDAPGGLYVAITSSGDGVCAVEADGWIDCWGGDGLEYSGPSPQAFTSAAFHHCLIEGQQVSCNGSNTAGRVDDVPSGRFSDLAAHTGTTCAKSADRFVCWGNAEEPGRFTLR